jgi:hypothetical protein
MRGGRSCVSVGHMKCGHGQEVTFESWLLARTETRYQSGRWVAFDGQAAWSIFDE